MDTCGCERSGCATKKCSCRKADLRCVDRCKCTNCTNVDVSCSSSEVSHNSGLCETLQIPTREMQHGAVETTISVANNQVDCTALERMIVRSTEKYDFRPVVSGPFLLNISNDAILLACGALLFHATNYAADESGRWMDADERESRVLREFSAILKALIERANDNAEVLKRGAA